MKTKAIIVLIFITLLSPVLALAQEENASCEGIYLVDTWARATAEGAPTGAVFGYLVNLGLAEDTLLSASSDIAEAVEIHETIMGANDMMQMQPLTDGLSIAPQNYQELRSGGLHIMLINLTQALAAGASFELLLNFEHAGEVSVTVPIRDMTTMDEGMGIHGQMDMHTSMMNMAASLSEEAIWWDESCAKVHVLGAWVRPTMMGMPNSAAYALLLNLSEMDDTLLSAETTVANATEIHEMSMGENDVMQMRPVDGGIPLPRGGTAILKPGGYHVMLIGLTQGLELESSITLSLSFEHNGTLELTVPVREAVEAMQP